MSTDDWPLEENPCPLCGRTDGLPACSRCKVNFAPLPVIKVKLPAETWYEEIPGEKARRRNERKGMTPKERRRDYGLYKAYGISLADYNRMLAEQEGGCGICGTLPYDKTLHVDHDHVTKQVRGLLCGHCNSMLGSACDSVDNLQAGIEYLLQKR